MDRPPKILFEKAEIAMAVDRIARSVASWTIERGYGALTMVHVLEGAGPFARDLVARLTGLEVVPWGTRVRATEGNRLLEGREWTGMDQALLKGKAVLIVDDLADSGKTLGVLSEGIRRLGAAEVRTAVLVRKFGDASGPADLIGFDLGWDRGELARQGLRDRWLFGYGMDLEGRRRELDHIGYVEVEG